MDSDELWKKSREWAAKWPVAPERGNSDASDKKPGDVCLVARYLAGTGGREWVNIFVMNSAGFWTQQPMLNRYEDKALAMIHMFGWRPGIHMDPILLLSSEEWEAIKNE